MGNVTGVKPVIPVRGQLVIIGDNWYWWGLERHEIIRLCVGICPETTGFEKTDSGIKGVFHGGRTTYMLSVKIKGMMI